MALLDVIQSFFSNYYVIALIAFFFLSRLLRGNAGPIEEFPGNKVQAIHSEQDWEEALARSAREKKLLVVDFFATWCGPCRYAAPVFGKMSTEYDDVIFAKVDVDEMRSIAMKYNVRAMPTFAFFKGTIKVDSMAGWSESRVRNNIEKMK